MINSFTAIDVALIVLVIVVILIIAGVTARNVKGTSDYYTGGRKFPWWLVSCSYAMILLSSQDFITYSQTGYLAGLVGMAPYLGACFGWCLLNVVLQTPVMYYGGYYTINEWIEKRYDVSTKLASSIAVFVMMVALMGFNFYVVGILLNQLFGIPALGATMIAAAFVTFYVLFGGIKSIMSVNIFEAVLIYILGLSVAFIGLYKVGGFAHMMSVLPSSYSTLFQPINDSNFPLLGVLFGIGFASNGAWFFCNQANLQKAFTSRSMNQARVGTMVFGLVLMPIGAIMTVAPGLVAKAMVNMGMIAEIPGNGATALLTVASDVLGPGGWGLYIAALMCAMAGTADSYINSSSTMFTNDIFKHFVPNKDDKYYLMVSRIAVVVIGIGVTYLMVGVFTRYELLMTALFSLFAAVMPGMMIVTIGGLLSSKIPSKAATACILFCIVGVMLAIYFPDTFCQPFVRMFGAPYPSAGSGLFNSVAGLAWGLAGLLIFWPLSKKQRKEDLIGTIWNYPPTGEMEKLYFHALRIGKRGIVDLNKEEIFSQLSQSSTSGEEVLQNAQN